MIAEELLLRRRESAERWKANNYAYYLLQKRALSCREEYKALRRERYRKQQELLRSLEGFVSPIRGRPKLYTPLEALKRKRESAKRWAATHRTSRIFSTSEKYQPNDNTGETSSAASN